MNTTVTSPRIIGSNAAIRFVSYLTMWFSYLTFMSIHAPRGVNWLSWHLQRIYNAVEYVEVNGYFSSFGFSIWSSCQDCGYAVSEWVDKIYLSNNIFKLFPYSFLNHLLGFDGLQKYGPQVDRLLILIAGVAAAELIIICVHKYSSVPSYFVGVVSFVLFVTAPWTYRMLLSSWTEVYFLPFFLLGILFFAHGRNRVGLIMLFFSGFFNYQWAFAVAGLYFFLFVGSQGFRRDSQSRQYLPKYGITVRGFLSIMFVLLVSVLFEGVLKWLAQSNLGGGLGSSLLFRMGISGDDIHNGGLLGALQFLGGNRVTLCLTEYGSGVISTNITDGITLYNCLLSIIGMVMLSLAAIIGLVILLKKSEPAKWIVFPLVYSLMLFITMLQQSLSAHLMGYSYIFSFLFAAGIVSLMVFLSQFINSSILRVILSIPCVLGIVFLSIRVSMITGVNG